MNCETGFLHSFGLRWVPVCRSVEDPRGARHWGRIFVPQTSHEGRPVNAPPPDPRVISLPHSSSGPGQLLFLFPLSNAY
jgi:hypothetical protein